MWGSFVFLYLLCMFFVFNQGCYVFIKYNLLEGYCKLIPIQLSTKVLDYSLPKLTWHIRLRISIFHPSIFVIVVHGTCYISYCCYLFFCYLFLLFSMIVGWSLFFIFVLMSLDSSLSNQEPILTFSLVDWSLNFIIVIMLLWHYNILCY